MTIREAALQAAAVLREGPGETPLLDATLLLADVLGITREQLIAAHPEQISPEARNAFLRLVNERSRGVPVAYLLGRKEFYGLEFTVSREVLVPRPDSELVVEVALELIARIGPAARLHDCCTGSGCIAVAVASAVPQAQVSASDLSPAALRIAHRNAERLTPGRVRFQRSDYLQDVEGCFDVITANPPYLTPAEIAALASGEPREALDGGADGLAAYRRLIPEAVDKLTVNGYLVLEGGREQHAAIAALLGAAGFDEVSCYHDLGGAPRVTVGRLR